MSILYKSIKALSQQESINYKIYTSRLKQDKLRKDIKLFDLIRGQKDQEMNETEWFKKLYPKETSRNVYAQLRSRLLKEVNNSLVQSHFQQTEIHTIYNELELYKIFVSKNNFEVAVYHLNKAEEYAGKLQEFMLLQSIYQEFINLSLLYDKVNPHMYLSKRDDNDSKLKEAKALDDLIAIITFELKSDQNFSNKKKDTLLKLQSFIERITSNPELSQNQLFKDKLCTANCLLLLSKKDYNGLEQYAISSYNVFTEKGLYHKNNHLLKLQTLSYICNILCVNQKQHESLYYLNKLKFAMMEFKNLYYDNYVFFYYNSLANNYTTINPQKAIPILAEASDIKAIKDHSRHLGYIYLSLAAVCFDLKKYKLAFNHLIKFHNRQKGELLESSFRFNLALIEMMIRLEIKKPFTVLEQIELLNTEYHANLETREYKKDKDFLMLVKKLISDFDFERTKETESLVRIFCRKTYLHPSKCSANFNKWLSEKFLS